MITKKEAKLGKVMSYTAGVFAILVFLTVIILSPATQDGYSTRFLDLSVILGLLGNFALISVVILNLKLFNEKENPLFRILSYITFINVVIASVFLMACVSAKYSVISVSFSSLNMIELYNFSLGLGYLVYAIYLLSIIQIEGGKLPKFGKIVGGAQGVIALITTIGVNFGLIPIVYFLPLIFLVGVILHPTFMVVLALTYKKSEDTV